jgi:hypothetical protein
LCIITGAFVLLNTVAGATPDEKYNPLPIV